MVLDVKRIINTPGGRIPFDFTEDFSDVDFGGVCPAVRPVSVVGQAENIAGMLRLQFDLTTTLSAVCDRCGAPFDLPYKVPFECLLAEELEEDDNDDILLLVTGTAPRPTSAASAPANAPFSRFRRPPVFQGRGCPYPAAS